MNKTLFAAGLAAAAFMLPGCATILDGTTQEITFDTNPQGAECVLERDGKLLSRVNTPNTIMVKKTKHDIHVSCTKDGYHDSVAHLKSKIEGSTWGNILLGGGVGWAIDSAAGSDNEYEDYVTITMVPVTAAAPSVQVIERKGVTVSEAESGEAVAESAAAETETAEDIAEAEEAASHMPAAGGADTAADVEPAQTDSASPTEDAGEGGVAE